MTEETKKEAEETVEVGATEETHAEEATQESNQEAEKPTPEDAKEPAEAAESAEKTTPEDAKEPTEAAESAEKTTPEDAQPGITDDELSRVFDAIPRKSKVALNRVESKMDTVKSAKSSPTWYPWLFSIIMIIGLMWAVVYYLTGVYPIPHIGAWNLCISFVTILVGFAMTMAWK